MIFVIFYQFIAKLQYHVSTIRIAVLRLSTVNAHSLLSTVLCEAWRTHKYSWQVCSTSTDFKVIILKNEVGRDPNNK